VKIHLIKSVTTRQVMYARVFEPIIINFCLQDIGLLQALMWY